MYADCRQVARPRRRSETAHAPAEQQPGAPVASSDLAVNDLGQALDPKSGLWHSAKALGVVGERPQASSKVTFVGFSASQDVSYKKDDRALRRRVSSADLMREQEAAIWGGSTVGQLVDGSWSVEKILEKRTKKRRPEYLVRWSGWSPDHDSWEREVDAEMVAEYEKELQRATRRAGRPAAPPKPPPGGPLLRATSSRRPASSLRTLSFSVTQTHRAQSPQIYIPKYSHTHSHSYTSEQRQGGSATSDQIADDCARCEMVH